MDWSLLSPADQFDVLLKSATILAGAVAFGFGLWQYVKAQAWKRHEFVAAAVKDLNANPLARNAMQMIDWGTRAIELFPTHPEFEPRYAMVTREVLHTALTTHDRIGRPYSPTEAAIRDAFDAYFGGLEQFEYFIQARLVRQDELGPYLNYWIRSICDDASPVLREKLSEYVRYYRFDGVRTLFARYGRTFGEGEPLGPALARETEERYEDFVRARVEGAHG